MNKASARSRNFKTHVWRTMAAGTLLATMAQGAAAAPAYTPDYYTSSTYLYHSDSTGSGTVYDPTAVSHNYPYAGTGETSGYSTLSGTSATTGLPISASGAYAQAENGSGFIKTDTGFQTSVLVGGGTSGLANGTAVTLRLSLQLDGNTFVQSGDDAGYANMGYSYLIYAPDRPVLETDGNWQGWFVPRILSFGADVRHAADNFFSCWYPCGMYQSISYQSSWGWNSNTASGAAPSVNDYTVTAGSGSISDYRLFNTGLVQMDFQTYVGDTINISSALNVYGVGTYGAGSYASADFLNTLEAGISSPYVSGIQLIQAGTTVVPVPAAMWLFGSGLLGLVGIARRRQRA